MVLGGASSKKSHSVRCHHQEIWYSWEKKVGNHWAQQLLGPKRQGRKVVCLSSRQERFQNGIGLVMEKATSKTVIEANGFREAVKDKATLVKLKMGGQ